LNALTERDERNRSAVLATLALGLLAIYGVLALGDGDGGQPVTALALVLLAFVLYVAALGVCRPLGGRTAFLVALAGGLAFRLILLPEPPFFSDDVWRYLWDGRVQLAGLNPFHHAPAETAVAGIDDALRAKVNHPHVPTIYPPLAQIVFLIAAALPGGWLALKLIWLICDAGIAALLWRLIPQSRRLSGWTVYWWSPLVIVEVAWNAHLDLLGVLPLVAALWLARQPARRGMAIGLALAGAALVKYFIAALLPAAARRHGPRTLAAFTAGALLLYLPYVGAGARLFEGLATYSSSWRFNEGLFHVLAWIATPPGARIIAALIVFAIVIQSARNGWSLERAAFWITGAILVLSPTLHPWYLLWMVPLIALRPNPAWLLLTGSVFLAYYGLGAYRATGVWPEPWWLELSIHGPFLVLLVRGAWHGSWCQTALEVWRASRPTA